MVTSTGTELDPPPDRCANCGARATSRFCPDCGQKVDDTNLRVSHWFAVVLDDLFDVDARLPRTLKYLFGRPGELAAEWSRGRRERYVRPLRLYLVSALIFFTVGVFFRSDSGVLAQVIGGFSEGSAEAQRWSNFSEELSGLLPNIVILLVPVAGLLLWLAFRSGRRYYSEHLVFSLHFHAVFFLAMSLVNLMPASLEDDLSLATLVLVLIYVLIAARRYFARSWSTTIVRGTVVMATYGALVLLITLLAGSIYVRLRA